ncbi:MAG: TIGR04053 family radical SAM/SPASM domain-containing protein [Planctomycetota bacterium]|nr:TIGR04053 family radical SAM/SPASM domain-containing protein [Planctomycetota bacterium]
MWRKYTNQDLGKCPYLVFYELTRMCDLACVHCRANAQPMRHPEELTVSQSRQFVEELARFPFRPLLVLTGGDPFKRPDLYELVHHATQAGLHVSVTPSATPLVDRWALVRLRDEGARRIAVSLDGAKPATHDGIRGVAGSFAKSLELLKIANEVGLPVQVNTTLTRRNEGEVDALAELLATRRIELWSVFFLVPTGRGAKEQRVSAEEYEAVFERLWSHAMTKGFVVKTTEAPHYRRFTAQRRQTLVHAHGLGPTASRPAASLGLNDGKGIAFVGHTGCIYPSGFLPVECGRIPKDSLLDVYRTHPVFTALRDPGRLKGKCAVCEFGSLCGGSRARAYAVTGDYLAQEPDCIYQPHSREGVSASCSA